MQNKTYDMESLKKMEEFYFNAQMNMYLSEKKSYDKFDLSLSDGIEDCIWNLAINLKINTKEEFVDIWEEIKQIMRSKNRIPAVYVTPSSPIFERIDEIIPSEFIVAFHDMWMILDNTKSTPQYKSRLDININEVSYEKRKLFVETTMKGFKTDDPNDPYGDIGDYYRDVLLDSFDNPQNEYKVKHYMAEHNGLPVSTASVISKGNIACVNNVVTIKEYKNNGICKEVMSNVFEGLRSSGVDEVFLQTEKGSYVEKFYENFGFKTVFEGICYQENV